MLDGIQDLQVTGWLLAVVGAGLLAVLLAGWIGRRIPRSRGRWLVASVGLLVFVGAVPDCATLVEGEILRGECRAVLGTVTFVPASPDATNTLASLLLGVALAVGVAPLLVPVLRLRDEVRSRPDGDGPGRDRPAKES